MLEILLLVALLLGIFYLLAVVCDEFFVDSLEIISDRLKLSSDVAGATFMAIGSSAPELFTSILALMRPGSEDVGSGTIVGSAIFNILVIIGASALFRAAKLNWQPVVRDTMFYSFSIVILLISFWDGRIILAEALSFVVLYAVYIFAVIKWRTWFPYKEKDDPIDILEAESAKNPVAVWSKKLLGIFIPDSRQKPERYIITFVMSIVAIAVLSHFLVDTAVHLGELIHVPAVIISLTILAAGTSVPDLLSSIAVAKKGRGDMAISNAVGSNIFDILFGLGVPWAGLLIYRQLTGAGEAFVPVATENLKGSVFLLFATLLATFFMIALRNWRIGPKAGLLLIFIYLSYLGYNILSVMGLVNLTPL